MKNVYCYQDPWGWGQALRDAILKRSGSAQMFTHSVQVPDEHSTVAFVHFTENDKASLRLRDELVQKQHARTIPNLDEARLFNDRVAQFQYFGGWLPLTWYMDTYSAALQRINEVVYPVISKTRNSAGYKGIRFVADSSVAFREVNAAFDTGIEGPNNITQKDYLLWQSYVKNPGYTWRVLLIAQRYAIITKRYYEIGKDGIDCEVEQVNSLTSELCELLKFVHIFALDNGFKWCAVDTMCGTDNNRGMASPFVTAMTTTWPPWWFDEGGLIFDTHDGNSWVSTGIPAVSIWSVVADAIMGGMFDG